MLQSFALAFVAIFVALDIVGTLPMYVALTRGMTRERRNRVVDTSMWVALLVALVFLFAGRAIFRSLGIDLFDFKIAGGLVLLLISLADLVGNPEVAHRASGSTGIVPLAVPLISGPGLLTAVVLQAESAGLGVTLGALGANFALAWLLLRQSDVVTRLIGKDGTVVISKIAALLLAAIAVALIRGGIFGAVSAFQAGV